MIPVSVYRGTYYVFKFVMYILIFQYTNRPLLQKLFLRKALYEKIQLLNHAGIHEHGENLYSLVRLLVISVFIYMYLNL